MTTIASIEKRLARVERINGIRMPDPDSFVTTITFCDPDGNPMFVCGQGAAEANEALKRQDIGDGATDNKS